jgi:hypothetical protein
MFRGLLRHLQGELFCTLKSTVTFCDYITFETFLHLHRKPRLFQRGTSDVKVLVWNLKLVDESNIYIFFNFDVLLTVHLSIFISVINQLDAQNFCFTISLFHPFTCFEHMCSKHVQARNKLIVKQIFCASSWLITEINGFLSNCKKFQV